GRIRHQRLPADVYRLRTGVRRGRDARIYRFCSRGNATALGCGPFDVFIHVRTACWRRRSKRLRPRTERRRTMGEEIRARARGILEAEMPKNVLYRSTSTKRNSKSSPVTRTPD